MDPLKASAKIAVSGLKAYGHRLRIVAENMANADSLPSAPGALPYQRKIITFRNEFDRQMETTLVRVDKVGADESAFPKKFDPSHPAADRAGYVLTPNVNPLIEMMDMREAERSYEANLSVIRTVRAMMEKTMELLK